MLYDEPSCRFAYQDRPFGEAVRGESCEADKDCDQASDNDESFCTVTNKCAKHKFAKLGDDCRGGVDFSASCEPALRCVKNNCATPKKTRTAVRKGLRG
jgi:hypothetical protein